MLQLSSNEVLFWKIMLWKYSLFKYNQHKGIRPEKVFQKNEDMSSTSQKHKNFVSEPMGDKSVNELAGIGEVLSKRLEAKGFDKAYVVLGQFLVLKKHKELFIDWMKDICAANSKQASECYQCISDWCDEFL
ncbi:barrier-to-autointegration factor [Trichonephila clavata]|uniref:Barrier-to-autointegration factor-like protein n=1 Tax=Trichonephila clavata TaxID=2740835 RepID=A0A8X6K9B7_TRICU|nr:barrier-to-autointegration factor [Trichonephila clavata]